MSPYYVDPTRPYGARWVDPTICRTCDGFVPVAARQGVPHPLAQYLCLDHVLSALGQPVRHYAGPEAPTHTGVAREAFRARTRAPGVARTPPEPIRASAAPTPELELLAAAMLSMSTLGAVPLRTERTYGVPVAMGCHWRPPGETPRAYDPGRPVAWDTDSESHEWPPPDVLGPDDDAVPKAARTLARAAVEAGWHVRLTAGRQTLILKATRGGSLVLARYERGRHAAGHSRANGVTTPLDARRLAAILRSEG